MSAESEQHCIGLIGGLGVGAGIHYYRELVRLHSERGLVPQIVMVHADVTRAMKHVENGDVAGLAEYLAGLIHQLSAAGAGIAVVPAIIPHICAPELARLSPLPLVDLSDEVAREVRSRGLRRVALFGTRAVLTTHMFGRLSEVEVVDPQPEEIEFIHRTYVAIVKAESATKEEREGLSRLAHTLLERDRLDAVLLAGTDLAFVFNESNTNFSHVDCARLHLDAIMRRVHR